MLHTMVCRLELKTILRFVVLCYFLLSIMHTVGCVGPQNRCNSNISLRCGLAQTLWQQAIDSIVFTNFPSEFGKYRAVIWEDAFDNAWVTKGREVNITRQLIFKLDSRQRICVAAHELAHLKMGHYYAKMGIILSPLGNTPPENKTMEKTPHYGAKTNIYMPEGFGRNQEKEADRLALKYVSKLGLNSQDYVGLLRLFLKDKTNITTISERIRYILERSN